MNFQSVSRRSSTTTGRGDGEEPFEEVYVEVPADHLGAVSEMFGRRRGKLTDMRHTDSGSVHCTYLAPTRGLLGFRQSFLTLTRGNGIYHTLFHKYAPFAGAIETQGFRFAGVRRHGIRFPLMP